LEAVLKNKLQTMEPQHTKMAIGVGNKVVVMMKTWGNDEKQKGKDKTPE
jgi:hypothetical protein